MPLTYEIGAATDIGRREINEDRHVVVDMTEGTWCVAVFDGLGGQKAGEVASEMAMHELEQKARKWKRTATAEALSDAVDRSLREIHDAICKKAKQNPELQGMATTVVSAVLRSDGVLVRYAGDSMLFWSRGERLLYRSEPHLFDERITSCLGGPNRLRVSPHRVEEYDWFLRARSGDTIVLCSDGLLHSLAERTLLGIFGGEESAQALAERLVAAALKAGEHDNVTVVAVRVTQSPR